ncbi:MAG: Rid family detoxifying hydrolase [Desulfovibrionaceae bacterium]
MRTSISTPGAPAAVGSYSQAVRAGQFLFLSGQICVHPTTGEMERHSVTTQTRRIMENIKAVVTEAGATMDDVVHCRAFVSNMKHFPEFEAVYKEYFSAPFPARMTVASAGIYDNLDVEMDAIVYLGQ